MTEVTYSQVTQKRTGMQVGMPKFQIVATHVETGLVGTSDIDERSQHKAREQAYGRLLEVLASFGLV